MNQTEESVWRVGNESIQNICVYWPPKINSGGIWNTITPMRQYTMPILELQMLHAFVISNVISLFLKPFGVTIFASQILAGIIMGPAGLGQINQYQNAIFPTSSREIIDTIAIFGFIIFLFLMGVKMDVTVAFKTTKTAVAIGILSFISPIIVGIIVHFIINEEKLTFEIGIERISVTTMQSLTSLSVIACLLSELKILNSELGRLALSSAIVGDLSSIVLITCLNSYKNWNKSYSMGVIYVGSLIGFVFLLVFVFRPLMLWIIKKTPEGRPIKEVYIHAIMIATLGCSLYTHFFNQSPLFGPFLFGLVVPDGPPLGSALIDKFESFASGAFLALYVATSIMKADPLNISFDTTRFKFGTTLIVSTFLAKFISCLIPLFWSKMPLRDSIVFSLIMTSKGIIELSYMSSFTDEQIITVETFTIQTIGILLNSTIVPILVKFLYGSNSRRYVGYQKRTIMHLKPDVELRILACVFRPDNVHAFIDLLNVTCPTKQSPNVVYVLHLKELIGRTSPVFIVHQTQENKVLSSYEQFILAFKQYEQVSWGLVTVNAYTAISPCDLMHEDIYNMALDKQTNFILLPFHRKWSIDGTLEIENKVLKDINSIILKRSPCSIGILVDRGNLKRKITRISLNPSMASYCIAMIFIGGKDDREALLLAKRMAKCPTVALTVIHFKVEVSNNALDWDTILDNELLRGIKQKEGYGNIKYVEQVVEDGPHVALIVRSIPNGYDLIIVGRRKGVDSVQTSGLSKWSEFPELGVIGDILASPDLNSRTSILVVQQQQYIDDKRY